MFFSASRMQCDHQVSYFILDAFEKGNCSFAGVQKGNFNEHHCHLNLNDDIIEQQDVRGSETSLISCIQIPGYPWSFHGGFCRESKIWMDMPFAEIPNAC